MSNLITNHFYSFCFPDLFFLSFLDNMVLKQVTDRKKKKRGLQSIEWQRVMTEATEDSRMLSERGGVRMGGTESGVYSAVAVKLS